MTYTDLLRLFHRSDFQRIERDDRLVDIFPHEDREKGVELWELWGQKTVYLIRVHIPFSLKKLELYILPRPKLEQLLLNNKKSALSDFGPLFQGDEALSYLKRFTN